MKEELARVKQQESADVAVVVAKRRASLQRMTIFDGKTAPSTDVIGTD